MHGKSHVMHTILSFESAGALSLSRSTVFFAWPPRGLQGGLGPLTIILRAQADMVKDIELHMKWRDVQRVMAQSVFTPLHHHSKNK